jgi:UPF0755 protein
VYETERTITSGRQVVIIEPGAPVSRIASDLERQGVIPHALAFRLLVQVRGDAARLKAGTYELDGPLSLREIADIIVRGDVMRKLVTFPEGRNRFEMAEIAATAGLSAEEFRKAAQEGAFIRDLHGDATSLEGYLYPDTYDVATLESAEDLVRAMVQRFREVLAEVRGNRAGPSELLSVHEMVTLASIVELETGAPEERSLIASVFFNRLRLGMPLQTDPTVIYALRLAGRYDGNIRRADLQIDSPYNTYRRRGLPPGPIGSPGREALLAVLSPVTSRALYFVSRNDGTHVFSNTLRDHERAVDQFQRRRRRPASTPPPASATVGALR